MSRLFCVAAALCVVLFLAKPASPWEFDEILFFQALHHFDPIAHHPPPPGYPVFAAFGHVLRLVMPSDFATLVTISVIGSLIAFVLFALAFGRMTGDLTIGIAGAALFYFSPALLVHSTLPMSEPGALALLAAGMYFSVRAKSEGSDASQPHVIPGGEDGEESGRGIAPPPRFLALFGARNDVRAAVFLALTVGWRPQFAIFVVPFFLTSLILMRMWRQRLVALAVFTIVCLAWLVPLASAVGGFEKLLHFEAGQATYVSAHDADVSRSGWTPSMLAARFIAHPWGTKLESLPLLMIAAIGAFLMRRERRVIPLAVASLIYLAFALAVMDPADGVRYAIPFILGAACFAGVGSVWIARTAGAPSYSVVAIFAIASMMYVSSVVSQRASTWSPPAYAAAVVRWTFPANSVALYEMPLWPHAQYWLSDRKPMRVNEGLAAYFDRPDVPLFLFADGISHAKDARVFRWMPSDAYSKLTRNHYRVVSLIPVPPAQRFRTIRGVYVPERESDGEEWRWLDSPAELQLPHGNERLLTLRLGLPVIYPIEHNTLTISVYEPPLSVSADRSRHSEPRRRRGSWAVEKRPPPGFLAVARNDGRQGNPAALFGDPLVVELDRGKPLTVNLYVPAGAPFIRFETQKTFVPAQVPGSLNRDARRLAVKLYGLEAK